MSDSKTTPGPWFATNVEYPDDGTMSPDQDGTWTVSTDPNAAGWRHDGGCSGYGVSEANARLMAAAPDLLAALKEVVRISDRKHDVWDAAKAAIAKAEGSST